MQPEVPGNVGMIGRFGSRRLQIATLLGFFGLFVAGAVLSVERPASPPEMQVLFPADRSTLMTGTFNLIVRGGQGELRVDGQPQPWEPFDPPLRVAKIGLAPGLHEIRVGERKLAFSVALNEEEHEGPKDWPVFRAHAIPADRRCDTCHETRRNEGRVAVGALKPTATSCFACHLRDGFREVHSVSSDAVAKCGDCHALHGSTRKALLRPSCKDATAADHQRVAK